VNVFKTLLQIKNEHSKRMYNKVSPGFHQFRKPNKTNRILAYTRNMLNNILIINNVNSERARPVNKTLGY